MSLFSLAPSPGPRWHLGLQAAIALTTPIVVMTLLGAPTLGYIAASGAFTVLFVGMAPALERAKVLPFVAAGLITSATIGSIAAHNAWLVSVGLVAVAIVSATLAFSFRLGPPGPLFFVLVFGLSAQVVGHAHIAPGQYIATIAAGCAFAYLVAITPLLSRTVRARTARPLRLIVPGPSLGVDEKLLLLRVVAVTIIGVSIGIVVDPTRSYWIVGAAIAVIGTATVRKVAFQRGLHRVLGTVIGVGVYAIIAMLHPQGLWIALLLGVMQFTVEVVVVRHYALALMIITPLVLLLTGAATGQIGSMDIALERVVDTLVGAALGAISGVVHAKPPAD